MAASEGVDLEHCIVQMLGGTTDNRKFSGKIEAQGKQCADNIKKFAGSKKISAWHSDDATNPLKQAIYAKPEPKTDIVLKIGGKMYFVSVKMAGPIQLASGQGSSSAQLFKAAAESSGSNSKVLSSIIEILQEMPTRLLSESNKARIVSTGNEKLINEFIKRGKIVTDKSYEFWMQENKLELMDAMMDYMQKNPEFRIELIREALTGAISLKNYKGAVADSIVSPKGFHIIDDNYIKNIERSVTFDIRGKSRSGISGLALRIETR
jgi:hypothetical protein